MATNLDDLRRRLHNAQETFDFELKSWVDPTTDTGAFVIAGGCMALRNNDGGFLTIGIRDNGKPDERPLFPNVRESFHIDKVQKLVTKYSSESFSIDVHYVEWDGQDRVMIEVPAGVRIPVLCRTDLPRSRTPDGHDIGSLLRKDSVYVRTLLANGVISTSPATVKDWPRLMDICFNNREADIGAFFRRQLSGIDVSSASSNLFEVLRAARAPAPNEVADEFLNRNYERYLRLREEYTTPLPACGTCEVAAIISGQFEPPEMSQDFMMRLRAQIPRRTGWPPWMSLMSFFSSGSTANIVNDGWEDFNYSTTMGKLLEFSRMEPSGKFSYIEGLQDDLSQRVLPHTQLEFVGHTIRVTEIILTALLFSRIFCGNEGRQTLTFAFRWQGLKGRHLSSWSHKDRAYYSEKSAASDEVTAHTSMPITTANSAIQPHVERIVKPLFRSFGGMEFEPQVLSQIIDDTINNRL